MDETKAIAPAPAADEDAAEVLSREQLTMEARLAKRLLNKPDIDHLEDAVVEDEEFGKLFIIEEGQRVIVERYTTVLPQSMWLDTRVLEVRVIDQFSGDLKLWDADWQYFTFANFKTGKGCTYKIPPARGNPFAPPKTKKRKGPLKRRGRPPGVKNRPKEERQ